MSPLFLQLLGKKSQLLEIYNESSVYLPHYEAHENFVIHIRDYGCANIHAVPADLQCNFVTTNENCLDKMVHFNYIGYVYCAPANTWVIPALILLLLLLWCIYMFIILGETADRFFCPALTTLAKVFRMSDNLAGITLLAFGNGSADIFTAIALPTSDTEMMYSELLGAACFVVAVIAGTIIIIKPFKVHTFSVLRDALFFLFVVVFIEYSVENLEFSLREALIMLGIYVFYLIVVLVDHFGAIYYGEKGGAHGLDMEDSSDTAINTISGQPANANLFTQFTSSINPIDAEEWNESGVIGKIFQIIKAPIIFSLVLLIPVVDPSMDHNGWSKLLNILHCLTLPQFSLYCIGYYGLLVEDVVPLPVLVLIGSLAVAILVFFTSRTDVAPTYHTLYAGGSFIGSIFMISTIASEIVAMLETLGIVMRLSYSLLGLTVLAWGNSVGDLISNITLAKRGHHEMGFSACFGGVMFNTLIGFSSVFIARMYIHKQFQTYAREGPMGDNCTTFLAFVLVFIIFALTVTGFYARRSIGWAMIVIYAVFILFCGLSEIEFIHSYSTDHRDDELQ